VTMLEMAHAPKNIFCEFDLFNGRPFFKDLQACVLFFVEFVRYQVLLIVAIFLFKQIYFKLQTRQLSLKQQDIPII
jgi:hypothetical protein